MKIFILSVNRGASLVTLETALAERQNIKRNSSVINKLNTSADS